eukprot:3409743-Pleurochrysis_carterae.AAC.1
MAGEGRLRLSGGRCVEFFILLVMVFSAMPFYMSSCFAHGSRTALVPPFPSTKSGFLQARLTTFAPRLLAYDSFTSTSTCIVLAG